MAAQGDAIVTRSSPTAKAATSRVCAVCTRNAAKYVCPRCNISYCSVNCYKTHDAECVNKFHDRLVSDHMHGQKVTDKDKRSVIDILKREHEERKAEEEAGSTPAGLDTDDIENLNLEDLRLDQLSKERQQAFFKALRDGTLGELVQIWRPWWEPISADDGQGEIKESKPQSWRDRMPRRPLSGRITVISTNNTTTGEHLDEADNELDANALQLVPCPTNMPPLSALLSKAPSPLLINNVTEVLYAYVYTIRLYNGEWDTDAGEAVRVLFTVSAVLATSAVYNGLDDALAASLSRTREPSISSSEILSVDCIRDVAQIMFYKGSLLRALHHCEVFLSSYQEKLSSDGAPLKGDDRKRIEAAKKKLQFMISWANELSSEQRYEAAETITQYWTQKCMDADKAGT